MKEKFKAYTNPTQLLGILDIQGSQRCLIALAPERGLERAFEESADEVMAWHHDYSIWHGEHKPKGSFDFSPPAGPFDLVLFYLPKSKEYQKWAMLQILPQMKLSGRLIAVGSKDSGAASAGKMLEKFLHVKGKESARHCIAWDCVLEKENTELTKPAWEEFKAQAWGHEVTALTLPGVFAHGALDDGTRFLLDTLQAELLHFKTALDWGCGSGVIAALLKSLRPQAEVTAADINAAALVCAKETFSKNGLDIKTVASDGFSDLPDKYELIITNPPAHKGVEVDKKMTEKFIAEASQHLSGPGVLILVANSHLAYMPALEAAFELVETIARNTRFVIIKAKSAGKGRYRRPAAPAEDETDAMSQHMTGALFPDDGEKRNPEFQNRAKSKYKGKKGKR